MNGERLNRMLLDTCALLWITGADGRLGPETLQRIDNAPIVSVSAISAFEIAIKAQKGKLTLPLPADEWWKNAAGHHSLNIVQVSDDVLLRSVSLPRIHSDPADRIIIATALLHGLPVITADSRFAEYGVEIFS